MRELIQHLREKDIFKGASRAELKRRRRQNPYGLQVMVIYKGDRDHPGDYDNFTLNRSYSAMESAEEGMLLLRNDLGQLVQMPSVDFDYTTQVAEDIFQGASPEELKVRRAEAMKKAAEINKPFLDKMHTIMQLLGFTITEEQYHVDNNTIIIDGAKGNLRIQLEGDIGGHGWGVRTARIHISVYTDRVGRYGGDQMHLSFGMKAETIAQKIQDLMLPKFAEGEAGWAATYLPKARYKRYCGICRENIPAGTKHMRMASGQTICADCVRKAGRLIGEGVWYEEGISLNEKDIFKGAGKRELARRRKTGITDNPDEVWFEVYHTNEDGSTESDEQFNRKDDALAKKAALEKANPGVKYGVDKWRVDAGGTPEPIGEAKDIFQGASDEELDKRWQGPASRDDVEALLDEDSETTFEELQLTALEVHNFERLTQKIHNSVSAGRLAGDWADLSITSYDPATRTIFFEYKYGNDNDHWEEHGEGQFHRDTRSFSYNESVNEKDIFKGASQEDLVNRREEYAKKLKSKTGKQAYYVDFSGWRILAKDVKHAEDRAFELMAQGKIPGITAVELADEEYHSDSLELEPLSWDKTEPVTQDMGDYYIDFSSWIIMADNPEEAGDKADMLLRQAVSRGEVPAINNIEFAGKPGTAEKIPVMEAGKKDIFRGASPAEVKKRREEYNKEQLRKAEEWVAIAKQELETALEVEVTIDNDEGRNEFSPYVTMSAVNGKGNNGESAWEVYQNSEDAEQAATDRVREDLEREPELFSSDWLQSHMEIWDTDRRMIAQDEADDRVDEVYDDDEILYQANATDEYAEIQEQIDNLDSEAEDYDSQEASLEAQKEKILEDAKETVRDSVYDEIYEALEDPVQYFVHDQGIYRLEELFKAPFMHIDYDAAAEDAVATDGVAHFLDRYDGSEVELPSGAVAYGTN